MNAPDDDVANRIHRLAIRQLDGALNDSERADLIDLLKDDAEARRIYLAHMQDSVSLRWIFSGHCDRRKALELAGAEAEADARPRRRSRLAVVFAVAASVAGLVAWHNWSPADSAPASKLQTGTISIAEAAPVASSVSKNVATVSALTDVHWRKGKGTKRPPLLSRIAVGQTFEFTSGTLELTFDTGALVKVFGPAKFEISSANTILCSRGRATTLVGKSGRGFTIDTPKARIVDLGTEFGVNISPQGDTQVVVFQGSVDLMRPGGAANSSSSADNWTRRLEQGEAMMLSKAGEAQRLVAVQRSDFFPSSVADHYGHDVGGPVILDVQDNMRDGEGAKCYQIVHNGLNEDAPCFVDRSHEWNGVDEKGLPNFLLGADYVMPFNSDKFIGDLQVDVRVSRPATCYVFFDDNMSPPEWLRKNFKRTTFHVGMDSAPTMWHKDHVLATGAGKSIDFTFSVWSRDIPQRGIVTLGGVDPPEAGARSRGFNMYGIAVVAK
jgi:ferric-dicitrate binding protein FerR (iron transport regulator)